MEEGPGPNGTNGTKTFLACLAIFKNETLNLRIWLEHYLWQGVEHFYLIDNGSTDGPVGGVLQPYMDRGLVTYEFRPEPHVQPQHYAHMYRAHRIADRAEWLLVCDLDEFMFAPEHNLAGRLRWWDQLGVDAVYVHWLMFGSAEFHTDTERAGLGLDDTTGHPRDVRLLTRRQAAHHADHKYVVRTRIVRDPRQIWIHRVLDHAPGDRIAFDDTGLRLHHYQTQSRFYFGRVKATRGDADGFLADTARDEAYYQRANQNMDTHDPTLRDLVLPLPIRQPEQAHIVAKDAGQNADMPDLVAGPQKIEAVGDEALGKVRGVGHDAHQLNAGGGEHGPGQLR